MGYGQAERRDHRIRHPPLPQCNPSTRFDRSLTTHGASDTDSVSLHLSGASAEGLGIVLDIVDLLAAPGGLAATAVLVKQTFDCLTEWGQSPTISLGAAEQLCLHDLLRSNPAFTADSIRTLLVTEASRPGSPSEVDHTGLDLFTVIFADLDNSLSWLYLIDCRGTILHRSEGFSIPRVTQGYL